MFHSRTKLFTQFRYHWYLIGAFLLHEKPFRILNVYVGGGGGGGGGLAKNKPSPNKNHRTKLGGEVRLGKVKLGKCEQRE